MKTTPKVFDFKPLQNIFMKQILSFLGCKQPFSRTSFVAGGDFVLNTCNGGNYQTQIDAYLNVLVLKDSLNLTTSYTEMLKDSINELQTAISSIIVTHHNVAINDIEHLVGQTDSLIVNEQWEINQQIVDRIYYATLASEIDEFTPEQVSGLEDIVWQCPYTGGEAVYFARSLYAIINDAVAYNDDSLCLLQNVIWRQINTINTQTPIINIYPIPAKNILNIDTDVCKEQGGYLEIFNLLGEKVAFKPLEGDKTHYDIDISYLIAGVYYCKLSVKGGIITTHKIIIHK